MTRAANGEDVAHGQKGIDDIASQHADDHFSPLASIRTLAEQDVVDALPSVIPMMMSHAFATSVWAEGSSGDSIAFIAVSSIRSPRASRCPEVLAMLKGTRCFTMP